MKQISLALIALLSFADDAPTGGCRCLLLARTFVEPACRPASCVGSNEVCGAMSWIPVAWLELERSETWPAFLHIFFHARAWLASCHLGDLAAGRSLPIKCAGSQLGSSRTS